MAAPIFQAISRRFPNLRHKLRRAGMSDKPEEFIKKTVLSAFYMASGIVISVGLVLAKFNVLKGFLIVFVPIIFLLLFSYLLKLPDAKILSKEKGISKEIVFAGRHLIIELESGVSLYNSFSNLSKNYPTIGLYFKEIMDKVELGTSMEDALAEAVEFIPSANFRKMLWQVLNSIRTGSDISNSLSLVLEQISREQTIEVNKYGRKLNPLAMFYMIIAVILPSLGTTMMIVLSSFIEIQLSLTILIIGAFFLGFIQFMFLSIIKFSRPAIEF